MGLRAIGWVAKSDSGHGLCPAAKFVLWRLAHRHNDKWTGCFATQAGLASSCEIPEEEVEVHLSALSAAGLVQPYRYEDYDAGYRGPTLFLFAYEAQDGGKGHV
jgi:hypothetical protein